MKQRFWKMAAALVLAVGALSRLTISQWGWYQPEEDCLGRLQHQGEKNREMFADVMKEG